MRQKMVCLAIFSVTVTCNLFSSPADLPACGSGGKDGLCQPAVPDAPMLHPPSVYDEVAPPPDTVYAKAPAELNLQELLGALAAQLKDAGEGIAFSGTVRDELVITTEPKPSQGEVPHTFIEVFVHSQLNRSENTVSWLQFDVVQLKKSSNTEGLIRLPSSELVAALKTIIREFYLRAVRYERTDAPLATYSMGGCCDNHRRRSLQEQPCTI